MTVTVDITTKLHRDRYYDFKLQSSDIVDPEKSISHDPSLAVNITLAELNQIKRILKYNISASDQSHLTKYTTNNIFIEIFSPTINNFSGTILQGNKFFNKTGNILGYSIKTTSVNKGITENNDYYFDKYGKANGYFSQFIDNGLTNQIYSCMIHLSNGYKEERGIVKIKNSDGVITNPLTYTYFFDKNDYVINGTEILNSRKIKYGSNWQIISDALLPNDKSKNPTIDEYNELPNDIKKNLDIKDLYYDKQQTWEGTDISGCIYFNKDGIILAHALHYDNSKLYDNIDKNTQIYIYNASWNVLHIFRSTTYDNGMSVTYDQKNETLSNGDIEVLTSFITTDSNGNRTDDSRSSRYIYDKDWNIKSGTDTDYYFGKIFTYGPNWEIISETPMETEYIDTDTSGVKLKAYKRRTLYIIDNGNMIPIKDEYGGSAIFDLSINGLTISAYAVEKFKRDGEDKYMLAIKTESTAQEGGNTTNWDTYIIDKNGILDWASLNSHHISSKEEIFKQDMNDDGFIGILLTNIDTDTSGVKLKKGSDDGLYIIDNGNQILIKDKYGFYPNLDYSNEWDAGSETTRAYAVEKVKRDGEDKYILVTKTVDMWRNADGDETERISWLTYIIDKNGIFDWDSAWDSANSDPISLQEEIFKQDMNGDGVIGVLLTNIDTDTSGVKVKKGSDDRIYIVDNGNEIPIMNSWPWGAVVALHETELESSYVSDTGGSYTQLIYAVEKVKRDGEDKYILATKTVDVYYNWDGAEIEQISWQTYIIDKNGILDWNSVTFDPISSKEEIFKQDMNGDGIIGVLLTNIDTDTSGVKLKKGSDDGLYIIDNGNQILIKDSPNFDLSVAWDDKFGTGSNTSRAYAVEKVKRDGEDKYILGVKREDTFDGEKEISWDLHIIDKNGILDWNSLGYTQSISSKEETFKQDMNDDGFIGMNTSLLTNIDTDTFGVKIKKDKNSVLYIIDNGKTITIKDANNSNPTFNFSHSGGSGEYAYSHTSSVYAVEKFKRDGEVKYILGIKKEDTFDGEKNIFWETFIIDENGILDWGSGSWGQEIGSKEETFKQDMDGDGVIWNINNLSHLTPVNTDTALGVVLKKDKQGVLYISNGESNIMIKDSAGGAVAFDWEDSWAGETRTSRAYAVEGIDENKDGEIDYYKLAIKQTINNSLSNSTNEQWETVKISKEGIVDWTSQTFGDPKIHEKDLGQDLDGDGSIWTVDKLNLEQVTTDQEGCTVWLDSDKNVYIQNGEGNQKEPIEDFAGGLISFDKSYSEGNFSSESRVYAVVEERVGEIDVYKILIKNTDIENSNTTISYETVNINKSTMIVDWRTFTFYDNPIKLEPVFNLDLDGVGGISKLDLNQITDINTDKTGAKLAQTGDGSLFIKDGDTTMPIKGPDGGYVDFTFEDDWGNGDSFKSEAIAVQKVGTKYKLVVEETTTFGGNAENFYQVFTLSSTGELDWGDVQFRTKAELNETEFDQDINGDGVMTNRATEPAFADVVNKRSIDPEIQKQFERVAQSDIVAIKNAETTSNDNIEMFVKGINGSARTNYKMDVKIIQGSNTTILAKISKDTGLDTSKIQPLTGLMDFNVTIPNPKNYGKIISITWVLPKDTQNPKYLKRNAQGDYFDFAFDSTTGEGAKWDATNSTLTVYIRDNGKYDNNPSEGVVRDPGLITKSISTGVIVDVQSVSYELLFQNNKFVIKQPDGQISTTISTTEKYLKNIFSYNDISHDGIVFDTEAWNKVKELIREFNSPVVETNEEPETNSYELLFKTSINKFVIKQPNGETSTTISTTEKYLKNLFSYNNISHDGIVFDIEAWNKVKELIIEHNSKQST